MKSLFDNYRNLILFAMGILSLKVLESYDKLVNSDQPLYLYYLRSINWKFEVSIYYRFTDFEIYFDTGSCIFLHKRHKLTTSYSLKYSGKSIQISLTVKLWKRIINRNHKGLKTVRYNGSWNLKYSYFSEDVRLLSSIDFRPVSF